MTYHPMNDPWLLQKEVKGINFPPVCLNNFNRKRKLFVNHCLKLFGNIQCFRLCFKQKNPGIPSIGINKSNIIVIPNRWNKGSWSLNITKNELLRIENNICLKGKLLNKTKFNNQIDYNYFQQEIIRLDGMSQFFVSLNNLNRLTMCMPLL